MELTHTDAMLKRAQAKVAKALAEGTLRETGRNTLVLDGQPLNEWEDRALRLARMNGETRLTKHAEGGWAVVTR